MGWFFPVYFLGGVLLSGMLCLGFLDYIFGFTLSWGASVFWSLLISVILVAAISGGVHLYHSKWPDSIELGFVLVLVLPALPWLYTILVFATQFQTCLDILQRLLQ